jgi:glycosyltransferase involved in cell wall biosynthesis
MKILHIDTGKEWRGGQRQVYFLHKGLLEKGFESFVAANKNGKLVDKISENCIPFKFSNEIGISTFLSLKKIINDLNPDIVHSHDAHSLTLAVFAKYLGNDFKLIHTRRVSFKIKNKLTNKFKYLNKNIDRFVAISKSVKDVLVSSYIPENKIDIIYSGIDFKYPNGYNCVDFILKLKNTNKIIGCIANFSADKDHITLIEAFNILYKNRQDVYLILVGGGELLNEIKLFSKSLPCTNNIIFTGYQENIYNYLKCFDVFAITSKNEGLCTSIIDALSFGIPVVATRVGGIPELICENKNGYLCEAGDYENIAKRLHSLLACNAFEKNEIISSVKRFSVENMVVDYVELYRRII